MSKMFLVTGTYILDSTESPERTLHFKKKKRYIYDVLKKSLIYYLRKLKMYRFLMNEGKLPTYS